RALEALRGEARRPHAAARGLRLCEIRVTRAHALALDEASREACRQRDRVADAGSVEPEQLRRRRRAAEDAVDRTRAEAVRWSRRNEVARAAALHFVAGDERCQQVA